MFDKKENAEKGQNIKSIKKGRHIPCINEYNIPYYDLKQ